MWWLRRPGSGGGAGTRWAAVAVADQVVGLRVLAQPVVRVQEAQLRRPSHSNSAAAMPPCSGVPLCPPSLSSSSLHVSSLLQHHASFLSSCRRVEMSYASKAAAHFHHHQLRRRHDCHRRCPVPACRRNRTGFGSRSAEDRQHSAGVHFPYRCNGTVERRPHLRMGVPLSRPHVAHAVPVVLFTPTRCADAVCTVFVCLLCVWRSLQGRHFTSVESD